MYSIPVYIACTDVTVTDISVHQRVETLRELLLERAEQETVRLAIRLVPVPPSIFHTQTVAFLCVPLCTACEQKNAGTERLGIHICTDTL